MFRWIINYIQRYSFKTICNKSFSLRNFDFMSNYIKKYPEKNKSVQQGQLLFWTMRDINALKRNQTFVHQYGNNTIIIDKIKLEYYIYVDVFKAFSSLIPYYFGNLDVFIDNNLFQKYKKSFIRDSLIRHSFLEDYIDCPKEIAIQEARNDIIKYFKKLIERHSVC